MKTFYFLIYNDNDSIYDSASFATYAGGITDSEYKFRRFLQTHKDAIVSGSNPVIGTVKANTFSDAVELLQHDFPLAYITEGLEIAVDEIASTGEVFAYTRNEEDIVEEAVDVCFDQSLRFREMGRIVSSLNFLIQSIVRDDDAKRIMIQGMSAIIAKWILWGCLIDGPGRIKDLPDGLFDKLKEEFPTINLDLMYREPGSDIFWTDLIDHAFWLKDELVGPQPSKNSNVMNDLRMNKDRMAAAVAFHRVMNNTWEGEVIEP